MEILYEKDVHIIEYIQARFMNYKDVMISISNVFDPRYAFLLYAPILFSLDFKAGRRLMWVVITMEWSNHLLKWLLHGERPYWWVHETQIYNTTGKTIPFLHQFPITCETGPGSPSGHSQSTASVWYVIIQTFLQKNNFSSIDRYGLISKTCWFVYFLLLTAIGTSRIFIAAHFPHQCIFGIILGWAVAVSLENINQVKCNILQYSTITAGMMASAAFVYTFLEAIGTDPMWTINKAIKWCIDENYIHLDTTPLYSMMRYCGFMLGMGFGFNSSYFEKNYQLEYTIRKRLLCALLSVASCLLSEEIIFLKDSLILYYFQAFLLNMVLAYIIVAVIPTVTNAIWTIKEKNE